MKSIWTHLKPQSIANSRYENRFTHILLQIRKKTQSLAIIFL